MSVEPCSVLQEVLVAVGVLVAIVIALVIALVIVLVVVVLRPHRHRHSQPLNENQFDQTSLHSGGDMHHPEDHEESSSHVVTPDNLIGERTLDE